MILLVDMGNSNIELGLMVDDKIIMSERLSTDKKKNATEYAIHIHNVFELNNIDVTQIEGAIISSVVPELTYELKKAIKKVTGLTALVVGPGIKSGLDIRIENPKSLGADLLVGSVAAIKEYGYPLTVIDMGTATTIMVIDKNASFIGGAIVPGVMVSINALTNSASLLGAIAIEAPKKVISSQTIECMQSGIVYGQAGLLDGMIDRMEDELGYKTKVIATGGLAKLIVPYCRHEIILDNDLMIKGLKYLYDKNKKKQNV